MEQILLAAKERGLAREGILTAIQRSAEGRPFDAASLPPPGTGEDITASIARASHVLRAMTLRDEANRPEVLMGIVMKELQGRCPGKQVAERVYGRREAVNR
jgi:hypothetical protein